MGDDLVQFVTEISKSTIAACKKDARVAKAVIDSECDALRQSLEKATEYKDRFDPELAKRQWQMIREAMLYGR